MSLDLEVVERFPCCPQCGGTKLQKYGGVRRNKQRYLCTECGRRFQEPDRRNHNNCRHKGTDICNEFFHMKQTYERRTGKIMKKSFCKFWAFNPNGNKIWKTKP